jgi:hypothetical protein
VRTLTLLGLGLTLLGALMLSWSDLRGGKRRSWNDAAMGFPRGEAWLGFPLIVIGTALQFVAVVAE